MLHGGIRCARPPDEDAGRHEPTGGCHGQGPDARQQGEEETEGRVEQEEERRGRPLALRADAKPAGPESVRQEDVARARRKTAWWGRDRSPPESARPRRRGL